MNTYKQKIHCLSIFLLHKNKKIKIKKITKKSTFYIRNGDTGGGGII